MNTWFLLLFMHPMIVLHCDGGSRGNPGPAAYGFVLFDEHHKVLESKGERIGTNTNNIAEYMGLVKAMEHASHLTTEELQVYMDSELIVKQMKGMYAVKAPHLRPLYEAAMGLVRRFKKVSFTHVPRENTYQSMADAMVNAALDGRV